MKRIILAAVLSALAITSAVAEENGDAYPDIASIPPPLMQRLNMYNGGYGLYEENYVSSVLQVIRNSAEDKMSLTQHDIERAQEKERHYGAANGVNAVLQYDRNFDEKVTADEIRESIAAQRRNYGPGSLDDTAIDHEVKNLMAQYDTNGDGTITFAEAQAGVAKKTRALRYGRRGGNEIEAFLALDPNHDGALNVSELETLARKAFRTVDTDHDGIISTTEAAAVTNMQRHEAKFPDGCTAPKPSETDKIVFLSVGQAGAVADVTFSRTLPGNLPEETRSQLVTGAVQLNLAPGASKLYVVVQSQLPVIWNVSGDVQRISRLVVAGPVAPTEEQKLMAGAAGVPAANVTFMKGDDYPACILSLAGDGFDDHASEDRAAAAVKGLLGRAPDSVLPVVFASRITIDDQGRAARGAPDAQDDSSGLDPEVWKQARLMQPGGLQRLKGREVVTDAATEPYSILPGWAGIAQLVHDGVLVSEPRPDHATRIVISSAMDRPQVIRGPGNSVVNAADSKVNIIEDNQFRIVKDMKSFPPGVAETGARFVLSKGISTSEKPPACVISEETGKPINANTWLCR